MGNRIHKMGLSATLDNIISFSRGYIYRTLHKIFAFVDNRFTFTNFLFFAVATLNTIEKKH